MSLGSALQTAAIRPTTRADKLRKYAEQIVFDRSPFGPWITTLILFAVVFGGYAAAAWVDHLPWTAHDKSRATSLDHRVWVALVASTLIVCCALGHLAALFCA